MAAFHPDYEMHPAEDLLSSQYAQHVAAAKRISAIKEGAVSRGFTFACPAAVAKAISTGSTGAGGLPAAPPLKSPPAKAAPKSALRGSIAQEVPKRVAYTGAQLAAAQDDRSLTSVGTAPAFGEPGWTTASGSQVRSPWAEMAEEHEASEMGLPKAAGKSASAKEAPPPTAKKAPPPERAKSPSGPPVKAPPSGYPFQRPAASSGSPAAGGRFGKGERGTGKGKDVEKGKGKGQGKGKGKGRDTGKGK